MAIKKCTPESGNLLRNLANNINKAFEACAPESDSILLELANDINTTIEASEPEGDHDNLLVLKRLLNNINAAIGANSSERQNLLRNLANDIEKAIGAGAPTSRNPPSKQENMKSLPVDESYCDVTGKTMHLGLAGTFSLHRVCFLVTLQRQTHR
jgi:hypothetical protein